MAIDDPLEIAPEVSIKRHRRTMGFRQRDRFREQAARIAKEGTYASLRFNLLFANREYRM
jgi:hypothetical protein